ncbi:MAG: hypothetical protein JW900_03880 [Anaerolineae bacterium]|nr:hypothetical protein [Anaerolineae bacterium]
MRRQRILIIVRDFAIELVVYGVLVAAYAYGALQLLGRPLQQLFDHQLAAYAVVGLLLIVSQAVLLDIITTFLLDRLKLGRLE